MENKRTVRYKAKTNFLKSKNNLLIGAIILALVVLIVVLAVSSGKKPEVNVDLKANQQQVVEDLKDNSTVKTVGNLTYFTANDIEFLEDEEVDVKYYFHGDEKEITRIVYDVTKCDETKVDKLIKNYNKSYKKIKASKNTIENSTKEVIRWVSDDMKIYYEKLTIKNDDKDKVVTKRITFIPIKD